MTDDPPATPAPGDAPGFIQLQRPIRFFLIDLPPWQARV
jgi:hypothetical protein